MATFPVTSQTPPLADELELGFSTIMRALDTDTSALPALSTLPPLPAIQPPRSDSFAELLSAIQSISDEGTLTDADTAAAETTMWLPPLPCVGELLPPPARVAPVCANFPTRGETAKPTGLRKAYTFGGRSAPSNPTHIESGVDADVADITVHRLFPLHALQLERPEFTAWRRANGIRKLSPRESKRLSHIRRGVLAKVYAERTRKRREGELRKAQASIRWLRAGFASMARKVVDLERSQAAQAAQTAR